MTERLCVCVCVCVYVCVCVFRMTDGVPSNVARWQGVLSYMLLPLCTFWKFCIMDYEKRNNVTGDNLVLF
jgi:hypothetical protein